MIRETFLPPPPPSWLVGWLAGFGLPRPCSRERNDKKHFSPSHSILFFKVSFCSLLMSTTFSTTLSLLCDCDYMKQKVVTKPKTAF